jgi:CubicO group peptidase (beta-lactamase class C family)
LGPAIDFGLGFTVRLAAGESPMAGSVGNYWWGGSFRTLFVVDALRELVAVLMANETVYPIPRWDRIPLLPQASR